MKIMRESGEIGVLYLYLICLYKGYCFNYYCYPRKVLPSAIKLTPAFKQEKLPFSRRVNILRSPAAAPAEEVAFWGEGGV